MKSNRVVSECYRGKTLKYIDCSNFTEHICTDLAELEVSSFCSLKAPCVTFM